VTDLITPQLPADPRQVVRGVDEDGILQFQQVGIEEISYKGRWGALAYSSTEITPFEGDMYFVLDDEADKFLVGDDILITCLDDFDCYMWGVILSKDDSTGPAILKVFVDDVSDLSVTSSNWELQVTNRRKDAIPLYQINGLRVSINGADALHDIDIDAGSVRDSTDSVDLVLTEKITKRLDAVFAAGTGNGAYVQTANLSGTITSGGIFPLWTLTGTGTTFLSDVTTNLNWATLTDYAAQYAVWKNSTDYALVAPGGLITCDGETLEVSCSTDTAGTVAGGANPTFTNATFKRGGFPTAGRNGTVGIVLIRSDADGSCDICSTAFTASGTPDLPSGYPYYRVIAAARIESAALFSITQPLKGIAAPTAEEVTLDPTGLTFVTTSTVQEAIEELDAGEVSLSQPASTTAQGLVELADAAETIALTANNRVITPAGLSGLLFYGTYTPTVTNHANAAGSTAFACQYLRIGDTVTVSGKVNVDPTAAGPTLTEVRLTLPFASTFAAAQQLGGAGAAGAAGFNEACSIDGSTANRASLQFMATTLTNHSISFSFTYRIV
jgi:hypothetical protein